MPEKREIKRKRMFLYFIEATREIIDEEGYEAVTLRKVADLAGYNSATVYSYFEDLEQLILYASLKYLKDYNYSAGQIFRSEIGERQKLLEMWRVFCDYSFQNPKPFAYIFTGKHKDNVGAIAAQYYDLYPEDVGSDTQEISLLVKNLKLEERNDMILRRIEAEEDIQLENRNILNDMMVFIYRGLLDQCLHKELDISPAEYTSKMMEYLDYLLSHTN